MSLYVRIKPGHTPSYRWQLDGGSYYVCTCGKRGDLQYSRNGLDRSIAEHIAELTTEGEKQ